MRLPSSGSGTWREAIRCARPSTTAVFAYAGLADEDRVVLGAADQHLHEAQDLVLAADDRVELAVRGEQGQVNPILLERLKRALGGGAVDGATAADFFERLGQHGAVEAGAFGCQGELVARIGQQCQQQVLGAGELVAALLRVGQGLVEGLFATRGDVERACLRGDGSAGQLGAQPFEQHRGLEAVELLEGCLDETVWLAKQAEQQVLGVELVVAEAEQQLLDTRQRLAGLVGEFFERNQGHILLVAPGFEAQGNPDSITIKFRAWTR